MDWIIWIYILVGIVGPVIVSGFCSVILSLIDIEVTFGSVLFYFYCGEAALILLWGLYKAAKALQFRYQFGYFGKFVGYYEVSSVGEYKSLKGQPVVVCRKNGEWTQWRAYMYKEGNVDPETWHDCDEPDEGSTQVLLRK
jgi:hypothetical protein